jgi:transcriptional regulator with XRE-family HTH domain
MPTADQIRMARAAVHISVRELAEASGLAESTILGFEGGKGDMLTVIGAALLLLAGCNGSSSPDGVEGVSKFAKLEAAVPQGAKCEQGIAELARGTNERIVETHYYHADHTYLVRSVLSHDDTGLSSTISCYADQAGEVTIFYVGAGPEKR